jgi:hypothetical protein
MLEGLKQRWREFRRGRPGHRFQERHERNREARSARSPLARFFKPFAAVVLLAAGIVFFLIPGPGLPLLLIGAALLADVSLRVARAMDWLELRIRALLSRLRRWWSGASAIAKSAVVISTLLLASGAAYGVFRIVMMGTLMP